MNGATGRKWPVAFLLLLIAAVLLVTAYAVQAQESQNRAALVVRLGEDEVVTRCVAFPEESVTGYELLERSGLDFEIGTGGVGLSVCSVEQVGCPPGNCFCECKGDPCVYWSYWHLQDSGWNYSVVGATLYEVSDRSVEGWSWGPGTVSEAIPPPDVTFDDICGAGEGGESGESTSVATTAPQAIAGADTDQPSGTDLPETVAANGVAEVTADTIAASEEGNTGSSWLVYVGFALIVVLLGGVLLVGQRRREAA